MDWEAAGKAISQLIREFGLWGAGGVAATILLYKFLDAWGKRGRKEK